MASQASSEFTPSPKQIVFLFIAAAVVAVVVFLCGVLVGRGVPLGQAMTGRGLSGGVNDRLFVDDRRPAVINTPSREPSAAAAAGDELSYYRRLGSEAPADVDARLQDAAPAPVPDAPELMTDAPPPADEDAPRPVPPLTDDTSVLATPPTDAPTVADRAVSSARRQGAGTASDGFTVQVTALRERAAAQRVADRLTAKGFPAFVVDPVPDAPVAVFRVRVGRYADRQTAERISQRLESEEGFQPWITR